LHFLLFFVGRIPKNRCKFLTEKIMRAQNFNLAENFLTNESMLIPTVVSHLVVVVGLCTDDPKDF